jgi:hypothetical protein
MPAQKSLCLFALVLLVVSLAGTPLHAVAIANPGTANTNGTTPSADDPGWNYVGQLNGASCVYLGNNWVITSAHVGPGNPTFFDGVNNPSYTMVPGSSVNLVDSPGGNEIDLVMFRITSQPTGLTDLTISTSAPGTNGVSSLVTAIGYGRNQSTTISQFVVNGNTLSGYTYDTGYIKRWGTNTVNDIGFVNVTNNIKSWTNQNLMMTFDSGQGGSEFQYADGDSGGGLFVKDVASGKWSLAGINEAVNSQVAGAATFGDPSFAVDLSHYRNQIVAIVPEPSTLVLLGIGALSLIYAWRRKMGK